MEMEPWMQMGSSGNKFIPSRIEECVFNIRDLAKGLSRESRFAGQTFRPYSVAQHSVIVSLNVPKHLAMEALFHDISEALIKDIPKPVKLLLPDYCELEERLTAAIFKQFGLQYPIDPAIKHADNRALATEKRDLLPPSEHQWKKLERPFPEKIIPWDSDRAYAEFLARYSYLKLREVA
jgi:5'-deoxynucleotidase YfbR-like HD superfamily hydrolase